MTTTTEALQLRPSQTLLTLIKKAIDEKHTSYSYDKDGSVSGIYHNIEQRGLDDYLFNEMLLLCKGRDLSNTRLRNNQIWKLWVWDLIMLEYDELLHTHTHGVYYTKAGNWR
jgi:hypothetical protein